jgi:hypothetical protein
MKIFFSWQADTPTTEGRNLIEFALRNAIGVVNAGIQLEQPEREGLAEIEIDKDTYGVPGSPPIVQTIFDKIDDAAIFVPDLTFIGNRRDGRPTPNPNVLIEYGWALKRLGYGRIVPVMNTAFGRPEGEAMPFNMRHLRHPIPYECPEGADGARRAAAKRELEGKLVKAIRAVLNSADLALPKPSAPKLFMPRDPPDVGRFRPPGMRLGVRAGWGIAEGQPIHLTEGPAIWLRLMPQYDPEKAWSLSALEKAISQPTVILPMLASGSGFGSIRDEDGSGMIANSSKDDETPFVVYLFKTGEILSIDTWHVAATAQRKSIPLDERQFAQALEQFEVCLKRLGLTRPFQWIAGMEGIEGRGLWHPQAYEPAGRCVSNKVAVSGTLEEAQSARESLDRFFAEIYELCGRGGMRPAGGFTDRD